mgnify:CR=1 FL=1|tara:strand:+ start:83 stop:253 length:171 start_codon:yes stop_codon:yes gene_type:complete
MTATWDPQEKPGLEGGGWDYDDNLIEYDSETDPESEDTVKYNGVGTEQSWTNQNES